MKSHVQRFEGQTVLSTVMRVKGTVGERVGQLSKGEEVFFVGKGVVSEVGFKDVREALTRVHVVAATDLFLVERKDGERMLTEGALLSDERLGIQTLFNDPDDKAGEP